eukprot:gene1527-28596_t
METSLCSTVGASTRTVNVDLGCLGCDAGGGSHVCGAGAGEFGQSLEEVAWERSIWSAASDGDLIKVKKALTKERLKASAIDGSGFAPLHYAARKNRIEVAKVLLAASADVNALGGAGKATALVRAAAAGHTAMVTLLVTIGADPVLADGDGKTPLHKAAECGHVEVAAVLNKGIKVASVEHPHKLIEVEAAVDRRGKTAAELAKTAKKGRSPDLIAELVKLCSLTDS